MLEKRIAPKVDKCNGRPGMTLWSIFVCGVLRLDLNIDYDRLLGLVRAQRLARSSGRAPPYKKAAWKNAPAPRRRV
jgi:hypothetical protein